MLNGSTVQNNILKMNMTNIIPAAQVRILLQIQTKSLLHTSLSPHRDNTANVEDEFSHLP